MDEFVGFKARSNICLGVLGVYLRRFCLPIEGALQAMNWKAQDKDGEGKPKSCEGKLKSSEDKQLKDSDHKQNKAVKTSKIGR